MAKDNKEKDRELLKEYKDIKFDHLFKKRPKRFNPSYRPPAKDLSRIVKWPKYIQIQRKKAILKRRFKTPQTIAQFKLTIPKDKLSALTELATKYQPETPKEKKKRLLDMAKKYIESTSKCDEKTEKTEKKIDLRRLQNLQNFKNSAPKAFYLRFGLKFVTRLIETRRAKLVVIAADVDPIEMVLFLPTLCRRMDVPYCIVKSKAFLGRLVRQKTATCVAFTEVRKGKDEAALGELAKACDSLRTQSLKAHCEPTLGVKAMAKRALAAKVKTK